MIRNACCVGRAFANVPSASSNIQLGVETLSYARRGDRRLLVLIIGGLLSLTTACQTVEFYEKGKINDPAMKFEDSATEIHLNQKTAYSREGTVGGIGTGAGGGCGCY